ncbi:unnamed protein product [Linum tenue]|nr:unnamed protein product [Linum tenue]
MVIITTINEAWAEPGSILDLFLESFWSGDGTQELVRHLVIVSLDQKAHQYCQAVHPHCYALTTPGVSFTGTPATFKSDEFMLMVWRRMEFYTSVLKLGIDFVFTDVDIVWFRNPFPHFHEDADFQIACDIYTGDDSELHYNSMNGGFGFVRSNDRARRFFQHWHDSRERFPGMHEQDVLNKIKDEPFIDEIGLRVKVLDTDHFGGICQPIKDLNVGCTMHATCCIGMESKIRALTAVLQDWKHFSSSPPESRNSTSFVWKPERTGCWM